MENLEKQKMLEGLRERARKHKENLEKMREIKEEFLKKQEEGKVYRLPWEAIRYFDEQSKWFEEERKGDIYPYPLSKYDRAEKDCKILGTLDYQTIHLSKHNLNLKKALYRELFRRSQVRYEEEDEPLKFKMAFNSFFRPLLSYEERGQKAERLNEEREKLIIEQNNLIKNKFIPKEERTKRLYQIAERIREIKNNPNYSSEFRQHIDNLPHFIPNYQKEFERFSARGGSASGGKKSHPEESEAVLKEKFIVERVPDILEKLYQDLYQMHKKRYLDKKSSQEKL